MHARAGQRQEALKILEDLKRRAATDNSALTGYAVNLAILYAGLGEKDQAFAWLEKAYQEHDAALTNLRVDPFFDPLRSDPRFQAMLKKMGLNQ